MIYVADTDNYTIVDYDVVTSVSLRSKSQTIDVPFEVEEGKCGRSLLRLSLSCIDSGFYDLYINNDFNKKVVVNA